MKKITIEKKLEIINSIESIGLRQAAGNHKITYSTLRRWYLNFIAGGIDGLKSKTRRDIDKITKLTENELQKIEYLKKEHNYSASKIKEELNLSVSVQTINKHLRKRSLKATHIVQDLKIENPFVEIVLDIKKLKNSCREECLPNYILTLTDLASGLYFCALSHDKSNLSVAIFLDYVMENLKKRKIITSELIIHTGKGQAYISKANNNKRSFLEHIISRKYKGRIITHSYRDKKKLVPGDFNIDRDKVFSVKDLIYNSFAQNVRHNNLICSSAIIGTLKNAALDIPPIIVDHYISDFEEIKSNPDSFWHRHSNNSQELLSEVIEYFNKSALEAIGSFKIDRAIKHFKTVVSLAHLYDNNYLKHDALQHITYFQQLKGKLKGSRKDYPPQLVIGEEEKSVNYEVQNRVMRNYARQYAFKSDFTNAVKYAKTALKLAEVNEDRELTAIGLAELAMFYMSLDKKTISYNHLQKARNICMEISNDKLLSFVLGNFGTYFSTQNKHYKAIKYIDESIELGLKIDYFEGLISNYVNLGGSYCDIKEYVRAKKAYIRALRLIWRTNYRKVLSRLYGNIANLFLRQDNFKQAIRYFFKKQAAAEVSKDQYSFIESFSNLAFTYSMIGKSELSLAMSKKAFMLILDFNRDEALKFFNEYLEMLKKKSEYNRGLRLIKRYNYLVNGDTRKKEIVTFNYLRLFFSCVDVLIKGKPRIGAKRIEEFRQFVKKREPGFCGSERDIILLEEMMKKVNF